MKKFIRTVTCTGIIFLFLQPATGQSGFNPAEYRQFLDGNSSLSAAQLLDRYPARTTYYNSRSEPADLSGVPWFDSINRVFRLTPGEKDFLADNFFMVSERLHSWSWAETFIRIYSSDLPLFISTDFVLQTLHESYDEILKTLEWQFLKPNLEELLEALYAKYPEIYEQYRDEAGMQEALADVDLYVSVARSLLLDRKFKPQKHGDDMYQTVMEAIEGETMSGISLFTRDTRKRTIDFSQFKPRGHYTEEIWTLEGPVTLENYFRAMMWLGRISFLMTAPPENPWEKNWSDEELLRMQLGALLLNRLVYSCGEAERLQKHEQIITFLVGPDDNLTPSELQDLADDYLDSPLDLFEQSTFDTFRQALNGSDDYGQKIMGNCFYVDPGTSDPGQLPVSYRLLGQKFLIDSYVFSEVVYDRIVYQNEKIYRPLPDPLDVMAVMGNEDAMALLEEEFETYKYAYKINAIKYLVDKYDEDFWEQSLYNTWLASVRELNPPSSSAGIPYFMQTSAWHLEKLNTQLTSWAMLRHDNILYGKQSYTGMTGCSYPYTYIEPYPECYQRIRVFAENAAAFTEEVFEGEVFKSKSEIVGYFTRYAEIMGIFAEIAEKELDGTVLSSTEIEFLKTMINSYMVSGPSISGWYKDMFYGWEAGLGLDFKVADVHTQPTDQYGSPVGHVLHVGSGWINTGVFLAPNPVNPGQLMAFTGPVSSFHYQVTDDFFRYTDQEWEKLFTWKSTGRPPRPDWVWGYLLDENGEAVTGGRRLKGEVYTGSSTGLSGGTKALDYLVAFPNPVNDELHLRFILNSPKTVTVEIFDATGRIVHQQKQGILQPAEHDLAIDLSGRKKGLYLVRVRVGSQAVSKQIIIIPR